MLRIDTLVFLFVGPTWNALDHRGAITDRVLPGTSHPCPFLGPGSDVRVYLSRNPSALGGTPASLDLPLALLASSSRVSSPNLALPDTSLGVSDPVFPTSSSILGIPAASLVVSDSVFPNSLPLASFSAVPASPLVASGSIFPDAPISVSILATAGIDTPRDDVLCPSSSPGLVESLSSDADMAPPRVGLWSLPS